MFNGYVVYTYGGGEALYEAFNAIAALTGGNDYLTLIKLFGVLALFWVTIEMGVHKMVNWHWFLMFMVMFNVFFVPKKTVTIIDRLNPQARYIVANVPFGLAAPAWLFSDIGDGLTTITDSLFSLPADLQYHKTGMVFGSKLMTEINAARFDDPILNKNLDYYAKQCIYYNIAYGFYSFKDITTSTNLESLLFSSTNNSRIRGIFYDTGTSQVFKTCAQAATQLKLDMRPVTNTLLSKFGNELFPSQGGTQASRKAHLIAALPVGYAFFSNISTTAQAQLKQAAISNFMLNSYSRVAASANATAAATSYATAVAERQQRGAWRTMAELSSRAIPIMHTVFEVLIYSLFFLVFLALLLPMTVSGKALTTWLKMIVWVQLWPVLYAVLNMVVSVYGKVATTLTEQNLSITSMSGMMGMSAIHSDMAMIAGYLAISIPILAWSLVNMGGQVMGMLAGSLMSAGTQAASQASGEAARGNISAGNTSLSNSSIMQNMTSPNTNIAGQFSDGTTTQTYGNNRISEQLGISNMGVNVAASESIGHTTSSALNYAKAQESAHAVSYGISQNNESVAASQFVEQAMHSENKSLQHQVMEATGGSTSFESSKDIAHQFAQEHNLTDAQAAKVLASASASIGGGFELFGNGAKVNAEVAGRGEISSEEKTAYQDAIKGGEAERYGESVQTEHKLAEIAAHNISDASVATAAQSLTDAHKSAETSAEQWSESSKTVQQLQKAEQYTHSASFKSDANMNQYLEDYINDKKLGIEKTDIGARQSIANSDEFAEYALHKSGIDVDINDDGKIEGWNKEMAQKAAHTGEHTPTAANAAPTTAQNAAAEHGQSPGSMPNTATSQQVDQKMAAAEQQASAAQHNLDKGRDKVTKKAEAMQSDIGNQSTHVAGRVAEKALDQITGYPKEAITSAMEAGNIKVPLGDKTVSAQGPKFNDSTGDHGTYNLDNKDSKEATPDPIDQITPEGIKSHKK